MRAPFSNLIAAAVALTMVLPVLGDPLVYEIDMKTGKTRSGLTHADVGAICRFVQNVKGIDHDVQQIDGLRSPEVEVLTGRDCYRGDALSIFGRSIGAGRLYKAALA